tara:strand:+ start:36 stop:683 length:648 start_codon:yes stop_codon:yes gene_type:complete
MGTKNLMKFTICNDDKVFPYLVVDNFYSRNEQKLIWEELTHHQDKDNFKLDDPMHSTSAKDKKTNKPLSNSKRIYLDSIYKDNRNRSNILTVYQKIISPSVRKAYRNTTPSWRIFEVTNRDASLVSYYENKQGYKAHFDKFMHSALIWFYKKPKRFKGGDLTFNQPNKIVECKHNRLVLFPSYYLHSIDEVNMEKKYRDKGLGRYCLTHFYGRNL